MIKLLQVKRKRGRRYLQLFTDLPDRNSLRPHLHQEAKYRKARILGKRGKCDDGFFHFHSSIIIEILEKSRGVSCDVSIEVFFQPVVTGCFTAPRSETQASSPVKRFPSASAAKSRSSRSRRYGSASGSLGCIRKEVRRYGMVEREVMEIGPRFRDYPFDRWACHQLVEVVG